MMHDRLQLSQQERVARARATAAILAAFAAAAVLFIAFVAFVALVRHAGPVRVWYVAPGTYAGTTDTAAIASANELAAFALERSTHDIAPPEGERYAADGLVHLADAVEAVARRTGADTAMYSPIVRELRGDARTMRREGRVTQRAAIARTAFASASSVITALQERAFPHLSRGTTDVRQAADAIRIDRSLQDQVAEISTFFDRASGLLRAMAVSGP
jgi:hypothetical protein